jgi:glutaredoxin
MVKITVYSSNMCGACEMVKAFLELRNVEFIEKNVSTDVDGRAELIAMGFDSTPVTVIGKQKLTGFDTVSLDAAILELENA